MKTPTRRWSLMHGAVRLLLAAVLVALVALALACGKKKSTEPDPTSDLPPQVVQVFPAARSSGVDYRTKVWARFREPLDPASVSATTVFLKVDTRRVVVSVALADSDRVIMITPVIPLAVRRTHTIELSSTIRTAAGVALGDTYFWQFTTLGVRHIDDPEPADRAQGESPVSPLFWQETEASAGLIEYRLYVGADSAAVASDAVPAVTSGSAQYVPPTRWSQTATTYWKVRVRNVETAEEAVGPVWSFTPAAIDAPVDSMTLHILDSGYWDNTPRARVWRCPNLVGGTNAGGLVRFDFGLLDSALRVADAYIVLSPTSLGTNTVPQIWATTYDRAPCDIRYPGFPPTPENGFLASGAVDGNGRVRFASSILAAHIQARIRQHPNLYGYAVKGNNNLSYNPFDDSSGLRIFYYPVGSMSRAQRTPAMAKRP